MLISAKAMKTAAKYRGEVASGYEARRKDADKWRGEHRVVADMLAPLPPGTQILDIPCGTGRFFDLYAESGFLVTAIDISQDMLAIAAGKKASRGFELRPGSIFEIDMPSASVDVALCIRIVNLIDEGDMQRALMELQRVARHQIIFNIRVGEKGKSRYRNPQKLSAVEAALQSGWSIAENREIHEPDFRMLRLEHAA